MDNEKRLEKIEGDITTIKENHLSHIQIDMARLSSDMGWLKQWHWVTTTAAVGAVVTGIINLIH